jgi:hypothetical protein
MPPLSPWLPQKSDSAQVEAIRSAAGLTPRDNVRIFIVPPGQRRVPVGSSINTPHTSPRLQRLLLEVSLAEGRILDLESGAAGHDLSDEDRNRLIHSLRHTVRQGGSAISDERRRLSSLPRSGWIVAERE